MRINIYGWLLSAIILAGFTYYLMSVTSFDHEHAHEDSHHSQHAPLISPISNVTFNNLPQIRLGFMLFNDPKLSSDGQTSCQSCHDLKSNGAETTRVSTSVNGTGTRNSPTVFNVSLNTRFFWDGRAVNLANQIDGPIHDPLEMNNTWENITQYVADTPKYQAYFYQLYNNKITADNIKLALISFMETLNTPDAPFDLYLQGNLSAISDTAKIGWHKFQKLGCIVCHQDRNIGGNLFQRFGNISDEQSLDTETDTGRFAVTGNPRDKFVFRVASLRNVAKTAPYFHDGRAETLEDAITIMAKKQLGQELDAPTIVELSAFLSSLTAPNPAILEVLSK